MVIGLGPGRSALASLYCTPHPVVRKQHCCIKNFVRFLIKILVRSNLFTTSQEGFMKRHDTYVGLLTFTVLVIVIGFGWSSFVLADESPASSPTVQEEKGSSADTGDVQERGVSRQKSRLFSAPLKGTPAPISPGGGGMNFTCNRTSCTCQGDADCNDMFGSGNCRGKSVCDETQGVECTCLRY